MSEPQTERAASRRERMAAVLESQVMACDTAMGSITNYLCLDDLHGPGPIDNIVTLAKISMKLVEAVEVAERRLSDERCGSNTQENCEDA